MSVAGIHKVIVLLSVEGSYNGYLADCINGKLKVK